MSLFAPIHMMKWIEENRDALKPPVGNKMVWKDERGTIIMIVGGHGDAPIQRLDAARVSCR